METFFTSQKDVLFSNVEVKWNPALFYMHMYYFTCIGVGISNTHKFFVPESWFEFQALIFVFDGGGVVQQQKRSCRRESGKTPGCPLSFLFFFKTRSKSTFLCPIWSKLCPQKRTKR